MRMTNLISGSSGNCSFLLLDDETIVFFDLGISYKQLKAHTNNYGIDLESEELNVIILITHEHLDHWNNKTYLKIKSMKHLNVELVFPQKPYSSLIFGYSVDSMPFKHGNTISNFYVVDGSYGYLTDVEGSELFNILIWDQAYNLKELFIEANYDEMYLNYIEQASMSNGYNVNNGFERHLSIQQSEYIIGSLKPDASKTLHHSSRFYDADNLKGEKL